MGHTRMRTAVLAVFLLLPAGVGIIAVHASPVCERLVRTYVTVPVRNRVSKATAQAWAKWRVGHPNWKPDPRAIRPKYVTTRKETVEKVQVACEVGGAQRQGGPFSTAQGSEDEPPPIDISAMGPMGVSLPDPTAPGIVDLPPAVDTDCPPGSFPSSLIAPVFFGVTGDGFGDAGEGSSSPSVAPLTAAPAAVTPEPPSFLLLALGMGSAWLFWKRRAATESRAARP
jgi:hypothetical protein